MSHMEQLDEILSRMTPAEKAVALRHIVSDLGLTPAGVEANDNVCAGSPCIVRTRIPVWLLEQTRRLGASEADILRDFPTLRAEDLVNAWAYVGSHKAEIEQQILDNEAE